MTSFEIAIRQDPAPHKELESLFSKNEELIIFDIGSCDGLDSLRYKRLYPKATVYAFEPVPANFEKIHNNFKAYGNEGIHAFQLAFSDKSGKASLHLSSAQSSTQPLPEGNKSSSLLEPDKILSIYSWCRFDQTIEVDTDTLDSFCTQNNIDHIDFIHLDVQGAELMVLGGATKLLSQVASIWLEVENVSLYKNQPLRHKIQSFMKSHDFMLIRYDHRYYAGDQFYVNRKFIKRERGIKEINKFRRREFWVNLNMPFAGLYRIVRKVVAKFIP